MTTPRKDKDRKSDENPTIAQNKRLEEVVVTNTIPPNGEPGGKITVLSVANLLGEGIRRIHENASVSSLFL